MTTRSAVKKTQSNIVGIRINRHAATVSTKNRRLLEVLERCITAERRIPRLTAKGVEIVVDSVCFSSECNECETATNLVPRITSALIEAGATVELQHRGKTRTFEPSSVRTRRGLAAARWKHAIMRFAGRGRSGQLFVQNAQTSLDFIAKLVQEASALNWLFVAANNYNVSCADAFFNRQLGQRQRTGRAFWQQRPYQVILTAKDAPLEFAHNDFEQIFVVDARCLLNASTRQFFDLVQCQFLLFRRCGEQFSAAEELLLDRLTGPVILMVQPSEVDQTVIVKCGQRRETQMGLMFCRSFRELMRFVEHLVSRILPLLTELFFEEVQFSGWMTLVLGSESLADEYRQHFVELKTRSVVSNLQFLSLEQIVMHGIPAGIVLFWQETDSWLKHRGPVPLRGDGIRIIVDTFPTQSSRYQPLDLTTIEIEM